MSDWRFFKKNSHMNSKPVAPPNRSEIEHLILVTFSSCPFCRAQNMSLTWGKLVPKRMTCLNCGATWEPLMSYDGNWSLVSAKLVSLDLSRKGTDFMNEMRSAAFWKHMSHEGFEKWKSTRQLKTVPEAVGQADKVVIIREIVKIRCPYCGGLYDEVNNRCPYCGGKR